MKIIRTELFSAVLCTTIVYSYKHTQMNSSYKCTRVCRFRFSLKVFCVFLHVVTYVGSVCLFVVSFLVYFLLFVLSLVLRLISEMT